MNQQENAQTTVSSGPVKNGLKALIGSFIGIYFFFIPVSTASGDSKIPLVIVIDTIKSFLGSSLDYITFGVIALLCATWIASRSSRFPRLRRYHEKDNLFIGVLFILAAVFSFMLVFGTGPDWLLNKDVGGLAQSLGSDVLLTVGVAGFLVFFLTEFGLPEFLGALMEPIMRRAFKVPGRAAVDAVASFVASPAVGVYITNQIYRQGNYTQREAASIATNFSVVSIGFFALLASIGGILPYLPHMLITSFILTFIVAVIMVRLPPLSRKKELYFDGTPQKLDEPEEADGRNILVRACQAAADRAASGGTEGAYSAFWSAITFAQRIVGYVLAIATLSLIVATYTPLFDLLGVVFEPILSLFQLPDADRIAPAVLISIAEVALPVIIISGENVAPMSVFFICVLSTVQIIFFTESANAMLESDIPLTFWNLIVIFLLRTVIAIPLIAIATHLIF